MNKHGFVRISACSPTVAVGNPKKNAENIIMMLKSLGDRDIIVFPELCISGYTCGDLFRQTSLLDACEAAINEVRCHVWARQLVFVGMPVRVGNELFNCAVVIHEGVVVGIVPKTNIPNYNEFYESRWFRAADGDEPKIVNFNWCGKPHTAFGTDLIFDHLGKAKIAVEICEDLWMPIPPSSYAAIAGANILVNLSASNETVAKHEYRSQLVANQSGRCVAAYVYSSAGPSESTTDLVFGGHCLISENGSILKSSCRIGDKTLWLGDRFITGDVDIEKLQTERRLLTSFGDTSRSLKRQYREVDVNITREFDELVREVNPTPFIPQDPRTLKDRCAEIFGIQCAGLAKRLKSLGSNPKVYIGVSGGLDSTLALLVAAKTFQSLDPKIPLKNIVGITMPGFGTTKKTKTNAELLMEILGITAKTIDIRAACLQTFKDIQHKPFGIDTNTDVFKHGYGVNDFEKDLKLLVGPEKRAMGDLVFENVQARERTKILMSHGFVLGTGDMSELALGWCTYNGDHMSMYNVNCSIPKTLVKFLVRYIAENEANLIRRDTRLSDVLKSICETIISPELLPPDQKGEIEQSTESVLGPYELHDFFLFNFVRNGFSPEKIVYLAVQAFEKKYSQGVIENTLKIFIKRFFSQQFKRSCVPDGPKVGSVSLSPRGDWRMPSDADSGIWQSFN